MFYLKPLKRFTFACSRRRGVHSNSLFSRRMNESWWEMGQQVLGNSDETTSKLGCPEMHESIMQNTKLKPGEATHINQNNYTCQTWELNHLRSGEEPRNHSTHFNDTSCEIRKLRAKTDPSRAVCLFVTPERADVQHVETNKTPCVVGPGPSLLNILITPLSKCRT